MASGLGWALGKESGATGEETGARAEDRGPGLLHFSLAFLKHLCISLVQGGAVLNCSGGPRKLGAGPFLWVLGCHTGFGSECVTSSLTFL